MRAQISHMGRLVVTRPRTHTHTHTQREREREREEREVGGEREGEKKEDRTIDI